MPTDVSPDKFAQYIVEFAYFRLKVSQLAFLMHTEADYSHCKKKDSITLCAAVTPVYNAQRVTFLSSLFFQSANTHRVCRRKLLLQHHGNIWIFRFPTRHQISLRCPDTRDQIHHTMTSYGTGILHSASACHITSDAIAAFPQLHGTTLAALDVPKFCLPDNISIVTSDEVQQLEDLSSTDIQRLRDVHPKVETLQQTFDVDSLLHIHRTMLHKQNTHWVIIITTSIGAMLILGNTGFLFYFRFYYILQIRPKPNNTTGTSSSPALDTSPANDEPRTESQERVLFAS